MFPDEMPLFVWPDGLAILSVVRPVGEVGAEHVFQVHLNGQLVGEADTIAAAAQMADRPLPEPTARRYLSATS